MSQKIELSKPVKWGESETGELELNLDSLTGRDLVAAENEFLAAHPGFVGYPAFSMEYQLCVAARSLGRPVDDLMALPARDANNLAATVNLFFA